MNTMISKESVNIATCLKSMRFKPNSKSKFDIPFYRMISLQAVRPYLKNDVMNLASHFLTNGYLESNGIFFVALENHEGKVVTVTKDVTDTWSPHWVTANTAFENKLLQDDDLKCFSNKMFHVWNGNHCLQAWLPVINKDHFDDLNWH